MRQKPPGAYELAIASPATAGLKAACAKPGQTGMVGVNACVNSIYLACFSVFA